jgi:quinol monooxygenase YgiN
VIIVSGWLAVDPGERDSYLAGCRDVIVRARRAAGCVDFHLSADPIEPGRVNIYEQWETIDHVERFRGDGVSGDQGAAILDASVHQHEVSVSMRLG